MMAKLFTKFNSSPAKQNQFKIEGMSEEYYDLEKLVAKSQVKRKTL